MTANEQMEKLHSLEMKIALEIKRICEKNGIRYFLTAGSTLGAVRHGGFIPWDDDMDIGMMREDYEKFIDACKSDLGEAFFLQTWDTDPNYPLSFAKVRLNGTHFIETFSEEAFSHNGIFVDIFPFDSAPDSNFARKIQAGKYYICNRLMWIKKNYGTEMKKQSVGQAIKYYLCLCVSKLFRYESVKQYFKKAQKKYNGKNTEQIVTDGETYKRESIPRKWVKQLKLIEFEKEEFYTYKDVEEYLLYFYGDYTKFPPEEERVGHSVKIDFGIY